MKSSNFIRFRYATNAAQHMTEHHIVNTALVDEVKQLHSITELIDAARLNTDNIDHYGNCFDQSLLCTIMSGLLLEHDNYNHIHNIKYRTHT